MGSIAGEAFSRVCVKVEPGARSFGSSVFRLWPVEAGLDVELLCDVDARVVGGERVVFAAVGGSASHGADLFAREASPRMGSDVWQR